MWLSTRSGSRDELRDMLLSFQETLSDKLPIEFIDSFLPFAKDKKWHTRKYFMD